MRKPALAVAAGAAALAMLGAQPASAATYAEDRAEIEDLMYRYLFAMDWRDAEAYAATFTEDGVLDYAGGVEHGRTAIAGMIEGLKKREAERAAQDKSGVRKSTTRHFVTNLVLKVDGNKAVGRAYWMSVSNAKDRAAPLVTAYGHYEDTLEKRGGKWLFTSRHIFSEALDKRVAGDKNPTRP
jgi:uncharacterized protein (TIGR02246 family)